TVFALELLNTSILVMSKTIFGNISRVAEQALRNRNRRDHGLVLCLYFFSDLDGKFYCVDMFTTYMSVCVVRTSASPFVTSFDYVISFADCLRLDMIVMVV